MRISFDINTQADFERLRAFFATAQWTGEERREEEALPLSSPSSLPPYPYPITPYNPPLPEEEKREEETPPKSRARKNSRGQLRHFDGSVCVLLSDKEYQSLIEEFGQEKTSKMIRHMDCYLLEDEKRQKKYRTRNHYMTLLNWERKDEKDRQPTLYFQDKPKEKTFHDIAVERGLVPDINPKTDFVDAFWRN